MPTFTLDRAQLRTALSHHLPIVKHTIDACLPTLGNVQFHVHDGAVTMLSTDRFVIAATTLQVDDMQDKRRVTVALNYGQLRLLRAWLGYMAPDVMDVRITDVGVTFGTHGTANNDLLLRTHFHAEELVDVKGLLQQHFNLDSVAATPSAAKSWQPSLISHMHNVSLWATGGDNKPGMFRAGNTYGIIMPMRIDVADAVETIMHANADLFVDTEPVADNVVEHPSSTGKE